MNYDNALTPKPKTVPKFLSRTWICTKSEPETSVSKDCSGKFYTSSHYQFDAIVLSEEVHDLVSRPLS